jgi:hypothetical protein
LKTVSIQNEKKFIEKEADNKIKLIGSNPEVDAYEIALNKILLNKYKIQL